MSVKTGSARKLGQSPVNQAIMQQKYHNIKDISFLFLLKGSMDVAPVNFEYIMIFVLIFKPLVLRNFCQIVLVYDV